MDLAAPGSASRAAASCCPSSAPTASSSSSSAPTSKSSQCPSPVGNPAPSTDISAPSPHLVGLGRVHPLLLTLVVFPSLSLTRARRDPLDITLQRSPEPAPCYSFLILIRLPWDLYLQCTILPRRVDLKPMVRFFLGYNTSIIPQHNEHLLDSVSFFPIVTMSCHKTSHCVTSK